MHIKESLLNKAFCILKNFIICFANFVCSFRDRVFCVATNARQIKRNDDLYHLQKKDTVLYTNDPIPNIPPSSVSKQSLYSTVENASKIPTENFVENCQRRNVLARHTTSIIIEFKKVKHKTIFTSCTVQNKINEIEVSNSARQRNKFAENDNTNRNYTNEARQCFSIKDSGAFTSNMFPRSKVACEALFRSKSSYNVSAICGDVAIDGRVFNMLMMNCLDFKVDALHLQPQIIATTYCAKSGKYFQIGKQYIDTCSEDEYNRKKYFEDLTGKSLKYMRTYYSNTKKPTSNKKAAMKNHVTSYSRKSYSRDSSGNNQVSDSTSFKRLKSNSLTYTEHTNEYASVKDTDMPMTDKHSCKLFNHLSGDSHTPKSDQNRNGLQDDPCSQTNVTKDVNPLENIEKIWMDSLAASTIRMQTVTCNKLMNLKLQNYDKATGDGVHNTSKCRQISITKGSTTEERIFKEMQRVNLSNKLNQCKKLIPWRHSFPCLKRNKQIENPFGPFKAAWKIVENFTNSIHFMTTSKLQDTDVDLLIRRFNECGKVSRIQHHWTKTGKWSGALVTYKTPSDCDRVFRNSFMMDFPNVVPIDVSRFLVNLGLLESFLKKPSPSSTVLIDGLPDGYPVSKLEEEMKDYGDVLYSKWTTNEEQQLSSGVSVYEFAVQAYAAVLGLNGKRYRKKPIRAEWQQRHQDKNLIKMVYQNYDG